MSWLRWLILAVLVVSLAGCDSSEEIPVSGTITLDGKPLADVVVTFYAIGDTKGQGGGGVTDADGHYTLKPVRGKRGLPPGEYRVVVNRPRMRDGSLPPPDARPADSDAVETLPEMYSSPRASKLKATVAKETTAYDFALETPKK